MMRVDWTYLQKKRTPLFILAKVFIALAGILLIIFPPVGVSNALFTLVLIGVGIQTIAALSLALFSGKKPFNESLAAGIFYFDLAIAYFLEFPFSGASVFFVLIPAFILLASVLLFSGKKAKQVLWVSLVLLGFSSFVFGFNGMIPAAGFNFITQLVLYSAMVGIIDVAKHSLLVMEKEKEVLKNRLSQTNEERNALKRRLSVLQQGAENLSKNVKRREIEIQNNLTLSEQMNIGKDSKDVLRSFLLTAVGQMGSNHAFVMAREKKANNFWNIVEEKGLRFIHPEDLRMYLDSNFISILRSVHDPIYVAEIPKDNLFSDELNFLNQFSKDVICPIYTQNRLIGMVAFGPKITGRNFGKEDFSMISIVANQSAFVLDQVQKSDDYRDQFSRTVKAMLYALEAKFMFTRGHLLRTTNYVATTARRLGFTQNEIQQMGMGSLLHDIGKTAIRDKYLLYDGALSNTDKDLKVKERILTHTVEGGKILKAAGFSSLLIDMALHHHEYFNGRGFPHGLAGEEIPIQTRILATCNAFDAMTSERPYRKALPKTTAIAVMEQQAGQQFDPEVVKAFLDVLKGSNQQTMYH